MGMAALRSDSQPYNLRLRKSGMGYVVNRPRIEGIGEKPTTPGPELVSSTTVKGKAGAKPATAKPVEKQPASGSATEEH
jgi:hypothetical protein